MAASTAAVGRGSAQRIAVAALAARCADSAQRRRDAAAAVTAMRRRRRQSFDLRQQVHGVAAVSSIARVQRRAQGIARGGTAAAQAAGMLAT
ncbi:hypothetical protein Dimus_015819, partial [Dionaea muscipula]